MTATTQTTAEILRSWAAELDAEQAQPLRDLAEHHENEIALAKTAAEASVLSVVVEVLRSPVEPETFAVRNAVKLLRDDLGDSIAAGKVHLAAAEDAKADVAALRLHLWGLAEALGLAPADHGALDVAAMKVAIVRLRADADRVARVRAALHP